jgi:hypothetical protein
VSDVDTWLAYRQERSSRSLLDPQLIERARAYLSRAEGEILIVDRGYAGRLRKL